MLREEEYEERVARVGDPYVKIFKISPDHPEQIKEYQEVLALVVNGGWGQILHVDRQYNAQEGCWMVYLEWVQWYMQDGHPEAAQVQNQVGPTNGQQINQYPGGQYPSGQLPGQAVSEF